MKNSLLALNIALLVAVLVLFYLHFASASNGGSSTAATSARAVPSGGFRMAYFEADSVQNHFEFYKEVSGELEAKAQANARVLGDMKSVFTNKYQELQKAANSGASQAELANKQQELQQMEKAFQGKEKMMNDEMQEVQFRKGQDVYKKIQDYLKEYNKDKGYSFIMASSNDMYLKDSAYDITNDLVKGLNALYKKKK